MGGGRGDGSDEDTPTRVGACGGGGGPIAVIYLCRRSSSNVSRHLCARTAKSGPRQRWPIVRVHGNTTQACDPFLARAQLQVIIAALYRMTPYLLPAV